MSIFFHRNLLKSRIENCTLTQFTVTEGWGKNIFSRKNFKDLEKKFQNYPIWEQIVLFNQKRLYKKYFYSLKNHFTFNQNVLDTSKCLIKSHWTIFLVIILFREKFANDEGFIQEEIYRLKILSGEAFFWEKLSLLQFSDLHFSRG